MDACIVPHVKSRSSDTGGKSWLEQLPILVEKTEETTSFLLETD